MHQREFICYLSEGFRSPRTIVAQRQQIGSDTACGRNIAVDQISPAPLNWRAVKTHE
jgi:hypothetical protein